MKCEIENCKSKPTEYVGNHFTFGNGRWLCDKHHQNKTLRIASWQGE